MSGGAESWRAAWLRPSDPRGRAAWRDRSAALGLAALYVALLLMTVSDLGYARDEGFYFHAARVYQRWFALLVDQPVQAIADIDLYWRTNSEHPALIKSLFAASHALFWERWQLFAMEGTSFRFPAMVLSGLGVGLTYLWGARAQGRLAGVVAAISLGAMPRFFHHAHLACFDAPVVTMWLLAAYAWWRALLRGGWPRLLLLGVAFGLVLNTKHNAWFLPIVCGAHGALWARGRPERRLPLLRAVAALAIVGPVVFYLGWPWIWRDTASRWWAYAQFHLGHVYYNMEYLGRNYWQPPMPRSYAFVMTVATVPMVTLLAAFGGAVASLRRPPRRDMAGLAPLWLLAIAVPYAAWLRPGTPIFGGTKHWMTAYPFLALLAGVAVARLCQGQRVCLRRPLATVAVAVACVLGPMVQAAHAHPWGLTAYTPVVGGAAGAASLGLNRGFWGYSTGAPAIVEALRRAPPGGEIYLHDTAHAAWDMLQRDGRVRRDLRGGLAMGRSDLALYHHELHMSGVMYQAWVAYGSCAPDAVAGLDGVPVVWTYRAPLAAAGAQTGAR